MGMKIIKLTALIVLIIFIFLPHNAKETSVENENVLRIVGKYQTIIETEDSTTLILDKNGMFVLNTKWMEDNEKDEPVFKSDIQKGAWKFIVKNNELELINENGRTVFKYSPKTLFTFGLDKDTICCYEATLELKSLGKNHRVFGDKILWKSSMDELIQKSAKNACKNSQTR